MNSNVASGAEVQAVLGQAVPVAAVVLERIKALSDEEFASEEVWEALNVWNAEVLDTDTAAFTAPLFRG